ncbi:MAG TPA: lycopene cyclase family protein, partial [Chloroflexota bacterium]|nr:lycopene cyclase family protein [Chloroflexota bacterium]
MAYPRYFLDATELRDAGTFDVMIVGTGPAGVALAEHLGEIAPHLHVGMLERGDHWLSTHISNVFRDQALPRLGKTTDLRRAFIEKYGTFPWRGQFQQDSTDNQRGGMMIHAVGGRGLVAGGHLRRFDPTDLTCWADGLWSISAKELARWSS